MTARAADLQRFLDCLQAALKGGAPEGSGAAGAADEAFKRLATPGAAGTPDRKTQPACAALADAYAEAETAPAAELAAAFRAIEPNLAWHVRLDRGSPDADFASAHANAVIVGDGGLEARSDVRIGASLLAPETDYPDHRHPPEEVYVALTGGSWRQELGPWVEPGAGGTFHNTPNILHGMRSGPRPLLAIWTLNM